MPFTAEDCKRLTGTDTPSYYTTPPDVSRCKNLNPDGPTPCWHPHCDCMAGLIDEDDRWLDQFTAGQARKEARAKSTGWGCAIAFGLFVFIIVLLASVK